MGGAAGRTEEAPKDVSRFTHLVLTCMIGVLFILVVVESHKFATTYESRTIQQQAYNVEEFSAKLLASDQSSILKRRRHVKQMAHRNSFQNATVKPFYPEPKKIKFLPPTETSTTRAATKPAQTSTAPTKPATTSTTTKIPEKVPELVTDPHNDRTTRIVDGLKIEGNIDPKAQYVITSASIPRTANQLKYIFYLPITGAVWKAKGFLPLIVLTGGIDEWDKPNTVSSWARDAIRNLSGSVLVYLETEIEHEVSFAQVSRLFAGGNFINDPKYDDTFFITTDVDLWPLNVKNHTLPEGKDILISRTLSGLKGCCMRSIALSCVGMRGKTWREVMNFEDCDGLQHDALAWSQDPNDPRYPAVSPAKSFLKWCMGEPGKDATQIQRDLWEKYERVYKGIRKTNTVVSMKNSKESLWDILRDHRVYNQKSMLTYLNYFFDKKVANHKVDRSIRGDPVNRQTWFIDQSLATMLVAAWVERHGGYPSGYERVEWGTKKINRLDRGKVWGTVLAIGSKKAEDLSDIQQKLVGSRIPAGFYDPKTGTIDLSTFQDAHLPGGTIYQDKSFDGGLYPFLTMLLPEAECQTLRRYQRQFSIYALEFLKTLRKRR